MNLRLLESLARHAAATPAAPAVRHAFAGAGAGATTYGELASRVWGAAMRIAHDVGPGEVVLLSSPNDAQFTISFLATLAAGAKIFPVAPELTEAELRAAVEDACAVAAVGTGPAVAALRGIVRSVMPIETVCATLGDGPPAGRRASDAGLLLQSSGTTGRPKIAFRDAASLDAVAEAMAEAIGFGSNDRVLLPLPLCHSYGAEHGLLAPVWAGSCVHLCRGFDLNVVLRELTGGGITIFPGVPFMYESLANLGGEAGAARPLESLRKAYSAGGPLPAAVFEAFRARYCVTVTQLYGATEIGSVTFNDAEGLGEFDPASVGRPMRGVDVRVLDVDEPDAARPLPPGAEGQVAVKAASMMRGYLNDEQAELRCAGGYFLTGDLGRVDAGDRLTITGRIKLLIDVGGRKVNPLEVEEVLAGHPEVAACVVLPVRVSETVCRLKAVVQPRDAAGEGPTAESLRRFARERLTAHKVPRLFEVRKSLPRSPTGKILRHMVAA